LARHFSRNLLEVRDLVGSTAFHSIQNSGLPGSLPLAGQLFYTFARLRYDFERESSDPQAGTESRRICGDHLLFAGGTRDYWHCSVLADEAHDPRQYARQRRAQIKEMSGRATPAIGLTFQQV
jgi:hypothetical protein